MKIPGKQHIKDLLKKEDLKVSKQKNIEKKTEHTSSNVKQTGSRKISSSAKVSISSKAKDIQKATVMAKASPDVRADKVDKLKREIDQGSYHVPSDKIADKIVTQIIDDAINAR